MSKKTFRSVVATASLVVGLSGAFSAHADGAFGGFLGDSPSNTDVWGLTCPIGTASARASVNDGTATGIQISVQVIDPHGRATTFSAVDGGGPSPVAVLNGGPGNYLVTVGKDATGGEGYSIVLDCHDASTAAIAGTQSALLQSQ